MLQSANHFTSLTKRETEILGLLLQGLNNREIAREIRISRETVKLDLKLLYRKLGVNNRVRAAVFAIRAGFLSSILSIFTHLGN